MADKRKRTNPHYLRGAENRQKAFAWRKAGLSYEEIARQLGCTRQNAQQIVAYELTRLNTLNKEEAELIRRLELERLDTLLMGLWRKAARGDEGAVTHVLKIMDRRARYLGLDAPHQIAQTDTHGRDVSPREDLLRRLEQLHVRAEEANGHSVTRA